MVEEFPLAVQTARNTRALTVTEILNRDNYPDMSLVRIEVDGINDKVQNGDCGALYIVVAAKGDCQFTLFHEDGKRVNRTIRVKKGDSVFIPKGTWYQDQGKMTMYSICSPAFDPAKVKVAAAD